MESNRASIVVNRFLDNVNVLLESSVIGKFVFEMICQQEILFNEKCFSRFKNNQIFGEIWSLFPDASLNGYSFS